MSVTSTVIELKNYINGEWRAANGEDVNIVINPANQEVIARAPRATKEETEEAIAVAKEAFESGVWSGLTTYERAAYLNKIADKIEENLDELATLEVMDNGKIKTEAEFDIADAASCFRYYAGLIMAPEGETYQVPEDVQAMVVKEPVGVAGLIVPWNFPMLMSVWKIAPALAAGNTIVYKPAEATPITAMKLVEIIEEVGVPKGVMNLVMGRGSVVGQTIAESKDVDLVSFTGSTEVGREIMKAAAGNLKKISLELGGKSPNIIFADADFETAVDYALMGIYYGTGQVCSAGSRILVEESIYNKFVEKFVERAKQIKAGPGLDENSQMGAINSEAQMNTILKYIEIGKQEGATLACGGNRLTENGLDKGFFIAPTVFVNVTSDMRIVQEEIFGPVVTIQSFKDEEEAIKLANDTDFGLAGGVFSGDGAKAMRVIKKVRAGITWVNSFGTTYNEAPWGGYKQSGIGRSLGTYGLDDFQEIKQININLDVQPAGWFPN
ncbi:MAG TPA: aldehyde dehydrogenase [Bacillus bacterium]|uniref:Betaine-aldehyde dehydrogenase n=1 Tax=Siminovitchia fordii TaxID=254759 RepID=A0ABQ4K747_9BACI|nr:aldehyde dehydrogenase family protein [Siminovitchia fordii]GIN21541.1 betaine-aldehyde dehydrogenase [Siminovitchia fordii]HBZ08918.1 aldehyde dehydrogenase [Bacillus sp. (in: firmicutes)]